MKAVALIFALFIVLANGQQLRRRLSRPKPTKSVQVYATMLVQHTADANESIPTTTLDGAEESGGEETQPTGNAEGLADEQFNKKTSSTMTQKTNVLDQCLIDEFIFTTKAAQTLQKSNACTQSIQLVPALLAVLIFLLQ